MKINIKKLSGCELLSVIESDIGYKEIIRYSNVDELLSHIETDRLIDTLCNDNNRDLSKFISEFFNSHIELNCPNAENLNKRLSALLFDAKRLRSEFNKLTNDAGITA